MNLAINERQVLATQRKFVDSRMILVLSIVLGINVIATLFYIDLFEVSMAEYLTWNHGISVLNLTFVSFLIVLTALGFSGGYLCRTKAETPTDAEH